VIDNPSLAEDSRFATLASRKENEDELDRIIEAWTSRQDKAKVMHILQDSGVAAGIVSNAKDQAMDPQLAHYHYFETVEHPTVGKIPFYHGPPFRLSETPYELGRATLIGEHNDYVYTKILGLSDEEFVDLVAEGVI
jgi:benzylsuccinate CoA-transferase BbsF subunit